MRICICLLAISTLWTAGGCRKRGVPDNQTVSGVEGSNISHEREFRGAWIATVSNIDWPSKSGLGAEQQKQELLRILDNLKKYRLNAALLQVRPEGDAMYRSKLEPWSRFLSGTQGKDPGYDPLEFFVKEAHARGITAHVWLNPYRAKASNKTQIVKPHIGATHPQFVYDYRTLSWMDPGAKAVEDKTFSVVMDLVERYDIDGVHIDDYFYPYPDKTPFPDSKTYAQYKQTGGSLSLEDWRRDNVNRLVRRVYEGIKARKSHIMFGISPFGVYRPGHPEGTTGFDQYTAIYADPKKWVDEGWLDYVAPQLYWLITSKGQPYEKLIAWWSQQNPKMYTFAGHNAAAVVAEGDKAWPASEIINQIEITKKYRPQLAMGDIFFSGKNIFNNDKNLGEEMAALYGGSALAPPVMVESHSAPTAATVALDGSRVKISHERASDLRFFVIYNTEAKVERIIDGGVTQLDLPAGTYIVTAVDKFGYESPGAPVSVP